MSIESEKNFKVFTTDLEMYCKHVAMDQAVSIEWAFHRFESQLEDFRECFSEESYKLICCIMKKVKEKELNINSRVSLIQYKNRNAKTETYKASLNRIERD